MLLSIQLRNGFTYHDSGAGIRQSLLPHFPSYFPGNSFNIIFRDAQCASQSSSGKCFETSNKGQTNLWSKASLSLTLFRIWHLHHTTRYKNVFEFQVRGELYWPSALHNSVQIHMPPSVFACRMLALFSLWSQSYGIQASISTTYPLFQWPSGSTSSQPWWLRSMCSSSLHKHWKQCFVPLAHLDTYSSFSPIPPSHPNTFEPTPLFLQSMHPRDHLELCRVWTRVSLHSHKCNQRILHPSATPAPPDHLNALQTLWMWWEQRMNGVNKDYFALWNSTSLMRVCITDSFFVDLGVLQSESKPTGTVFVRVPHATRFSHRIRHRFCFSPFMSRILAPKCYPTHAFGNTTRFPWDGISIIFNLHLGHIWTVFQAQHLLQDASGFAFCIRIVKDMGHPGVCCLFCCSNHLFCISLCNMHDLV